MECSSCCSSLPPDRRRATLHQQAVKQSNSNLVHSYQSQRYCPRRQDDPSELGIALTRFISSVAWMMRGFSFVLAMTSCRSTITELNTMGTPCRQIAESRSKQPMHGPRELHKAQKLRKLTAAPSSARPGWLPAATVCRSDGTFTRRPQPFASAGSDERRPGTGARGVLAALGRRGVWSHSEVTPQTSSNPTF